MNGEVDWKIHSLTPTHPDLVDASSKNVVSLINIQFLSNSQMDVHVQGQTKHP